MEAAYKRVIDVLNDCLRIIHGGNGELDHEVLKANLLIDNTFIQFQSAQETFPKNLKDNFNFTVSQMIQDFANFKHQISDEGKQVLGAPFERLETVLNLKTLELMKVEKVSCIDPEKILPMVQVMQQRYCEQDHDLKKLEKTGKLKIPEFNSQSIFSQNNFDFQVV